MARIRYMIEDVDQAITFYTRHLGFTLEYNASPAMALVARGDLQLLLSGPQSSGARPLPDGQHPSPGGWNRLVIEVEDLSTVMETLKQAGVHFRRDDIVRGPGGQQIWIEDPSGNLIEVFEPAGFPPRP
ncbi:VOC family protein [Ktedonospora formicarum]|uniref:Glyoxalase n=1 Tax=Ktedonospora formicarum TaxID=2778364 RepID=A0A8J3I8J9_9CHLR|nr:VOC family protein [Ktedonospora formicarum]GHO50616.1 glyoxalase [Ktedonospora formicarum]